MIKLVARVIFWVVFAVGWFISEFGGFLDWLSWHMARYGYHLNEVFELGMDLPDPDELVMVAMPADEYFEEEEEVDDEQDKG